MDDVKFKVKKYPLRFTIIQKPFYEKYFNLKTFNVNPCIHKENEVQFINALEYFDPVDSDGFYFSSVPVNDDLKIISRHNGYLRYQAKIHEQAFIDVSSSFDKYWSSFSSKTRSTYKRKINKIKNMSGGEIDWRVYQTPEELAVFYKLAKEISKKTYQETLFNLGLNDDQEYYDDMLKKAALGNVRGYLLFLNNEAVSYLFCPITKRAAEFTYLGYLPEYSNESVGTVLFLLALENIFNDKDIDFLDFKEGNTIHKDRFATGYIRCANIFYLKNTFTNFLWIYLNNYMNIFVANFISILDKMGVKKNLKRLLNSYILKKNGAGTLC